MVCLVIWYQVLIIFQLLKLSTLGIYHRPLRLSHSHHYNSQKNRQSLLSRSLQNEPDGTDSIEVFLAKELNGSLKSSKSKKSTKNTRKKSTCSKCKTKFEKFYLRPAFSCDEWSSDSETCILDRNVGATITLTLKFGNDKNHVPSVVWKQEFHLLSEEKTKEFVIDPNDSPWNIVIGSKGYEFRVSPITEQDVDFNYFSANLAQSEKVFHPKAKKLKFRIRIVPINLGFLYLGETITLNIESFISLPAESIKYNWHVEKSGEKGTLPSNMKKSLSGRVLTISELRNDQEGVVACSIYSNLNVFVAKRRFLVKHISKGSGYELSRPLNISKRKNRHLDVEGDIEEVINDMDKRKSDSNSSMEGFELPKTTSSSHATIKSTSIYHNKHLINHLSNFQMNPELEQFDNINHPLPYTFKPQRISNPYGEETLDDDESTTRISEHFRNKIPSERQKAESFNYFPQKQSFGDIDETSSTQEGGPRVIGHFQNKISNGNQKPESFNYFSQKHSFNDIDEISGTQEYETRDKKPKSEKSSLENSLTSSAGQREGNKDVSERMSKLISECNKNTQCSIHATCINQDSPRSGFCKCVTGFQGNGISCWEVMRFSDSD